VVVNDSLVLVHRANDYRKEYDDVREAVADAGVRRFRPILLTSLTTFLGLTPMIFETSLQARFLIPMAISLGFGVLFATFIILLMVPAFYIITEDLWDLFREIGRDIGNILRWRPKGKSGESGSKPPRNLGRPAPPETPDYPVTPAARREGGGPRG
jgi:predicted RND superfamily exporter protein